MFFFGFLPWLLLLAIIVFGVRAAGSRRSVGWTMPLSPADTTSQMYLLLSVLLLGVTMAKLNQVFSTEISWETILLITLIAAAVCAYFQQSIVTFMYAVLILPVWWIAKMVPFMATHAVIGPRASAILVGLLLYAVTLLALGSFMRIDQRWSRFRLLCEFLSIFSITTALFIFSTKAGMQMLDKFSDGLIPTFPFFWGSVIVLLITTIALVTYAGVKRVLVLMEGASILAFSLLSLLLLLLPTHVLFAQSAINGYMFTSTLSGHGTLFAIGMNLLLLLELLGLIFWGYLRKDAWLINLGAAGFGIFILVKYFDWFFTFLDKSVFFIGAGVLLFGVGWIMERGRRTLLARMKSPHHA